MSNSISISLDDENLAYLDKETSNRSGYINNLLSSDRKRKFEAAMKLGYLAQSNDPEIQAEDQLWEIALEDGIEQD